MQSSRLHASLRRDEPRCAVSRALLVFLLVFASLWVVAIGAASVQHVVFHRHHPYDSFLLNPADRHWDFTVFAPRYALWGQGERFFTNPGFPFTYPAPTLLAGLVYYKLFSAPLTAYLITLVAFAFIAGLVAVWALPNARQAGGWSAAVIFSAAICSFPLVFLMDRANLEGFVWFASAAGMAFFMRRRFAAAAVFLALAASMKIFPGVLLLLFLKRRRYREFGLAIGACAVFSVGSLWWVGPTIAAAARHISVGLENFRHIEILEYHPSAIGFDHSFFATVKQVTHFFVHDVKRLEGMLPVLYLVYFGFAAVSFGLLYFTRVRKLPMLNQVLALSAFSITLPFVSYDYTLVHMFAPFAGLILFLAHDVGAGRVRLSKWEMLAFLLPFAVILTPQSYLIYGIVSFGGQLKAAALLALIAAAIRIELPSTMFEEIGERSVYALTFQIAGLQISAPSRQQQPVAPFAP